MGTISRAGPDSGGRTSENVLIDLFFFTTLRSFLAFSAESEGVLVKQAVGAGL